MRTLKNLKCSSISPPPNKTYFSATQAPSPNWISRSKTLRTPWITHLKQLLHRQQSTNKWFSRSGILTVSVTRSPATNSYGHQKSLNSSKFHPSSSPSLNMNESGTNSKGRSSSMAENVTVADGPPTQISIATWNMAKISSRRKTHKLTPKLSIIIWRLTRVVSREEHIRLEFNSLSGSSLMWATTLNFKSKSPFRRDLLHSS